MLQVWEKGKFQKYLQVQERGKGHGKLKDKRKLKPAKVHELSEQAAEGLWTQQQYTGPYQQTAYYNPSPQNDIPEAWLHHMQTVQVNSLNKQEDNSHMWQLWVSTT